MTRPDDDAHMDDAPSDEAPSDSSERPLVDAALAQIRALAAEPAAAPLPVIPGYELERELHRGGQGVVYLARRSATGQEVAVKLLREELSSDAARARFEREVAVLAGLRHPALVAIHDCGVHAGRSYLVMDHVPGRDLDRELAARGRTLREKVELLARVAEAVAAAHQRGVLHRDLKPSNVRIDPDGNAVLLDFGLAKWLREGGAPADASAPGFIGSAPWASPEQVAGAPLDARSDVYSLGVLTYQALTGSFPYDVSGALVEVFEAIRSAAPTRPRQLAPELDRDLETILLCALAKDPDRRYASALDLARDLRYWLEGAPVAARRDSTTYVLAKTLIRHRVATAGVLGVLVLIVASALSVRASRGRWRDVARQLDAKVHAEYVRRIAEADHAGDGVVLAELFAAPPTERSGFALEHLRARFERAAWAWGGNGERPLTAAFSPDGAQLAIGTWEGAVRLVDAADGRPRWTAPEALAEVRALAFDPDGERLLAVESRALVELDARDGALGRVLEWPDGGLELLSVGARRVLIGGHGGAFALVHRATLDVVRAADLRELSPDAAGVGSRRATFLLCALHADSARAAAASTDSIRVWDVLSGEPLCSISIETSANAGTVSALTFSSDGGLVAFGRYPLGGRPGSLHVHDARTGARIGSVENLDESPTRLLLGARPATGGVDVWTGTPGGSLRRIELPSARTRDVLPGFEHALDALAFDPDRARLATIGREVRVWRLGASEPAPAEAGAVAAVAGAGWIRARRSQEGVVRIDESGAERAFPFGSGSSPRAIAIEPETGGLVAAWPSGVVQRVGSEGELEGRWELGSSVGRVATGGGRLIAALDEGTVLELTREVARGRVLAEGTVAPTALAVDVGRVAVARGHELSIFGQRRFRFETPARETITALAWLGETDSLAVGSEGGSLWILALGGADDAQRGEFLADLALSRRRVEALGFDAATRVLGCVTSDGVLELRSAR